MKPFAIALLFILSFSANAQTLNRPKLVVGIVVDQMRWDYLYRYYDRYGTGGFKRMLTEGFSCENTFIPYTPTYTAAGHACIYTGSVPALNGIIGNSWYDKSIKDFVYCTEDSLVTPVGTNSTAGLMSPRNMLATTIGDELRMATNFKSKVIGISFKDRGSILPAGHSANAAYWFDNSIGGFISSSHYMENLPKWMNDFNNKKLPDTYLAKNWNTLYPIETYTQSTDDKKSYEGSLPGEDNSFPHKTDNLSKDKYESFKNTPYGNSYTVDGAKAVIEGENLGNRGVTDMLAISFSTPDLIGHTFGPNSIEVEDCYLRLDKDLADFFTYLDTKIGKGQYLTFLTADHAVAHVAGFAKENKLPGGLASSSAIEKTLNTELQKQFGAGTYIAEIVNYQIHFNNELIETNKIDKAAIKKTAIKVLLEQPGVLRAIELENLYSSNLPEKVKMTLSNGYNQKLSGEIQFIYKPGWFEGSARGTTHGSWNPYDSHIPLLWFGWNIKPGKTNREVYMTDIAPTVAAMLQLQMPNACVGKAIMEITGSK